MFYLYIWIFGIPDPEIQEINGDINTAMKIFDLYYHSYRVKRVALFNSDNKLIAEESTACLENP